MRGWPTGLARAVAAYAPEVHTTANSCELQENGGSWHGSRPQPPVICIPGRPRCWLQGQVSQRGMCTSACVLGGGGGASLSFC